MNSTVPTSILVHCADAACSPVATLLVDRGGCIAARTWDEASSRMGDRAPDVVFLHPDGRLTADIPRMVDEAWLAFPEVPVVVITARGDTAATRVALRCGAFDCIEETDDETRLDEVLRAVLQKRTGADASRGEALEAGVPQSNRFSTPQIIGNDAFLETLTELRDACDRSATTFSVMMIELDGLAELVDRCTAAHDGLPRRFVDALHSVLPSPAILARFGFDRFVAALPDHDNVDSAAVCERLRSALRAPSVTDEPDNFDMRVTVGLVEVVAHTNETPVQLVERAWIALEHAKQIGRNQTVRWDEIARPFPTLGDLESSADGPAGYWIARMRQQLATAYGESTLALVAAAEAKEPFAGEHSLTVARYAEEIGRRMGLKPSTIGALRVAAMLHDIGKIGVPDSILAKPGPLSTEEYTVIKRHPRTALKILRHVSFLEGELPIILHHHEWFNGTGYPDGLAREQIPIGARVLAVADAIDAMRSRRAYKPAFDLPRVRAEIERGSAEQFDPTVATTAIAWLNDSPFDEVAPRGWPCGGLTAPRPMPRNARERIRSSDHTIVV